MKYTDTKVVGAKILTHDKYNIDNRGMFVEGGKIEGCNFVQINHSVSFPKVLRGLHYQVGDSAQGKLCWVTKGMVYDVFVDLRKDSETFGKWDSCLLSEEFGNKVWVPAGCAHGFMVVGESPAEFNYLVDKPYNPEAERTLIWNDTDLNIMWPDNDILVISEKDKKGISFKDCEKF